MSQAKDKKKSFNSSGGGSGGYNSPKHNNSGSNRSTGNNRQQQSPSQHNSMNSHHHHHHQQSHHQHQQQQQQQQQLQDGLSQMKDRTVYMSMSLIGQVISVTLKNGDIYEGILSSTQTNSAGWGLVLRMARKKDINSKVITTKPLPIIIIQSKDFLQLTATGVVLDHYRDSFMSRELFYTDTELSGFDGNLKERELTPWTPDPTFGESLEEFSDKKPSNWDQFEANEKLFGVTTSYDEDLYTTRLDKESEFYHKNQKIAERTAYEIENEKSSNIHLLEERGFIEGADYDEEERYSSVVRKGALNGSSAAANTSTTTTSTTTSSVYIPPSKRGQIAKTAAQKPQDNSNTTTAAAATSSTTSPTTTNTTIKTPIDTSSISNNNNNNNSNAITSPKTPNSNSSSTSSTPSTPSTPKSSTTSTQTISNNSPLGTDSSNLSKESPNISKLRFGSQTIEQEAMGSPREGLSPRSVAYRSYRQVLLSEPHQKLKSSNQGVQTTVSQTETPKSPAPAIVSNHGLVRALSLELATPVVPENVVNEFNSFKLKIQQHDRGSETLNLKTFSNNLVIKSKSRPGSPLIGSGSPRPAPTQLSLAATTLGDDQQKSSSSVISSTTSMAAQIKLSNALDNIADAEKKEEEKKTSDIVEKTETDKSTTTTTTTATTTTTTTTSTVLPTTANAGKKEEEKKDSAPSTTTTSSSSTTTTTTTMSSLKSRLKLNPNAKEFVPPSSSKLAAPKSTPESNTDSHTPINDIYYDSMKKRQQIQESPNTVPSFWTDPYIRTYEDQMDPNIYGYPPHIRGPHMGGVPFYGIPQAMVPPHAQILTQPPKGMIQHGGMIQQAPPMGKAIHHYNGPPPPGVPNQPIPSSQQPNTQTSPSSQQPQPQSPTQTPPPGTVPPPVRAQVQQFIPGHGQPPPPGSVPVGPNGQPFVFAQPFHPSYPIHHGAPGIPTQKRYPQSSVPHYAPQGVSPPPPHYNQPPIIIANPPSPQNTMNLPPNQDPQHRINYPTYIQRSPYHQNDQQYH